MDKKEFFDKHTSLDQECYSWKVDPLTVWLQVEQQLLSEIKDIKNKIDDIMEYMDKRDYDVVLQDLPDLSKELEKRIKELK